MASHTCKNTTPKPYLERHPKHEMSRCKHVRKLVSKLWHHLDCFEIVQLSQPCEPSALRLAPCPSVSRIWLRGGAKQVWVNNLDCFSLARDGTCHFDANLLKHTSCQVVAKTVQGFWTALSEVMQCQTSLYDDSTCGEVCCRYCVKVLRHSHHMFVPFC